MKKRLLIAIALLFVFASLALAQDAKTGTPNQTKKKRTLLSFGKPEQMFQILDGKWSYGSLDCSKPITIKVTTDSKTIKLIYPKTDKAEQQESIFVVSEVGKYYIRGQYEGENRKTDEGKLQVWDFMFFSKNEFAWHRTDWQGLGLTPPVTRCKEEKQTASLK